jgi:hypothetical protein
MGVTIIIGKNKYRFKSQTAHAKHHNTGLTDGQTDTDT